MYVNVYSKKQWGLQHTIKHSIIFCFHTRKMSFYEKVKFSWCHKNNLMTNIIQYKNDLVKFCMYKLHECMKKLSKKQINKVLTIIARRSENIYRSISFSLSHIPRSSAYFFFIRGKWTSLVRCTPHREHITRRLYPNESSRGIHWLALAPETRVKFFEWVPPAVCTPQKPGVSLPPPFLYRSIFFPRFFSLLIDSSFLYLLRRLFYSQSATTSVCPMVVIKK